MATDKSASNKITSLAFKKLREAHAEEYEQLKEAAAKELGVEYKRRKSAEEKARDTLATLLSQHPSIRAELVDEIAEQVRSEGAAK
jgi:hypothetical protein